MRGFHCTWAVLLVLAATPAVAQLTQTSPAAGSTAARYTIFLNGQPAGNETVTVREGADGLVVSSEGRMSRPVNLVLARAEVRYSHDGAPRDLTINATATGGTISLQTMFADGRAVSQGNQLGTAIAKTDTVSPRAIVLPNGFWGAYVPLARRLASPHAPTELRAYVAPQFEIPVRVESTSAERMQVGTTAIDVRRYQLVMTTPGGDLIVHVTTDAAGALLRVSIPAQGVDVVRDDLASSTSRTQVHSNPGDEAVTIPGAGFNLGATFTRPTATTLADAKGRLPAVVLHTGSGVFDRDGTVAGIATMGQLAGALARVGFVTVRYDKRGFGQSGGRSESATLGDFAEDLRAVVKWTTNRKDIDGERVAVIGHSEGALVAMLAASRDKRIAAVVTIAGPAVKGSDLILQQQAHVLDLAGTPAAERDAKIALQKQIMSAVLTGNGWEGVPAHLRREADTPWFQSLLAFDPAEVARDMKQPLLVVQGALDTQVPPANAEQLATFARARRGRRVDVVVVPGINHLLVPATTGEASEYGSLTDHAISPRITDAITTWLAEILAPRH